MNQIIFIFCNDHIGGAENVMLLLAQEFYGQGKNVQIVSLQYKQTHRLDAFQNVLYIESKNKFSGCLKYLFKYSKSFKENTILFSSQIHINGLLALSKPFFFAKSKLVLRESTQIFTRFSGFKKWMHTIPYYFYNNANVMIAQTDTMKNSILENFSKSKAWPLVTISNPISNTYFASKKEAFEIENKYNNAIVTAGRLIPIKAFDLLIKAYANSELLQQYALVIIGNGPENQKLQQAIIDANLQSKIFILGEVNNPFPYFVKAKMCVVSSILEGFPNVILEMMYCCNNVVSTNCAGDLSSIDGLTICEPNNIISLQKALEHSLLLKETQLNSNRKRFDDELALRSVEIYTDKLLASLA
jgi:glycosyltransferase involved in cell wall biosynthesis